MGYPPAAELLAIHGAGEDEAHLTQAMEYIRRYLIRIRGNREVQIIGPASEAVSKINDLYRMAVYVRAPQEEVLAGCGKNWSGISRLTKASVPFIYSLTSAESISFFILFTHRLFIIEEAKERKRIMAIREIRVVGDRVLTKKCRPVEKMTPRISELIDDMFDTMYEANGVGLAAPQVGILKRIVVMDVDGTPHLLINPEILETSGSQTRSRRSLSLPGKSGYSNPSELRKGKSTGPRHAAV